MGAQTFDEALEKASKAKEEFRLANMNLREYFSNDAGIYKRFSDDSSQNSTKFLGLKWALESDTLTVALPTIDIDIFPTKRIILKFIAKAYDPLGLICPTLIWPKRLIQNLWARGLSWV